MNADLTSAACVIVVPLRPIMYFNKDNTNECISYIPDEYKVVFYFPYIFENKYQSQVVIKSSIFNKGMKINKGLYNQKYNTNNNALT